MDPPLNKSKGRVKFNGHWETWFSMKRFPLQLLKVPGVHVDQRGLVLDRDEYIVVFTTLVKIREIIETSLGMGKRYDTCDIADTVDICTYW